MSVVVQLSKFEGPLALLYLIRKDEMDIFDIKINEITTQYLDYIKLMKELDLEVAGEFVAMAATLIQIKSKMLLPQYDEKGEIVETEDPRKELVQKLLEYQKYQEAARLLYERPLVGRDMWTRGVRLNLDEPTEEIEVEENGLFTMISLYRQIMRSAKKRIHQVTAKAQSIASRILEIKEMLTMGSRKTLNDLIGETENRMRQVLITFLSVLELAKLGFVGLYQTETYGDLWIDLKKPIEKDVVSAVEEYETIDESKADTLFAKAEAEAAAGTANDEEFVLVDAEDRAEAEESAEISAEDMATDDEILQAEMELAGEVAEIAINENITDEVKADIIDDIQAEETGADVALATTESDEATVEIVSAQESEPIGELAEQPNTELVESLIESSEELSINEPSTEVTAADEAFESLEAAPIEIENEAWTTVDAGASEDVVSDVVEADMELPLESEETIALRETEAMADTEIESEPEAGSEPEAQV